MHELTEKIIKLTTAIVRNVDQFDGLASIHELRALACDVEDTVAALSRVVSVHEGTLSWADARVVNVQLDEAAWAVGELIGVERPWTRELRTIRSIVRNALDRASSL
jgi:hypothetical protein